jgi:hypothetical protein
MNMGGNNDGQHRATPGPLPNSGQRQRTFDPRSNVGQLSGGENQMNIKPPRRDSDIGTTTESAGPRGPSERRGGADDRK